MSKIPSSSFCCFRTKLQRFAASPGLSRFFRSPELRFRLVVAVCSLFCGLPALLAQTEAQTEAEAEAADSVEDPFDDLFADLSFDEDSSGPDSAHNLASEAARGGTPSRWKAEAKLSAGLAGEGKVFRSPSPSEGQNRAESNPENRLKLRAIGLMLNFELFTSLSLMRSGSVPLQRKRLSIVSNFYAEANNEKAGNPRESNGSLDPQFAELKFGFRQLYSSFFASLDVLGTVELELSAGKRAYSQAASLYFNPMNYLDDSGSFFSEKNNWQLLGSLSWSAFGLRLRYMPVLRFHEDSELQANMHDARSTDYSSWEYAFSFLESKNRRQLFSLESSLFLGESNWQLIGYAMEKQRYDWRDGFYLALGARGLVSFNVADQYFQAYGEGLVGNGLNKLGSLESSGLSSFPGAALQNPPPYLWEDADLDEYKFRGLLGLKWTPIANLDFYFEYRYDGSALDSSQLQRLLTALEDYNDFYSNDTRQGLFWQDFIARDVLADPFALSQHIAAVAFNWRNIGDHLDLQAHYFLSLPDSSSTFQVRANLYLFDRSLQLYAENSWYLPSFAAADYWLTGAFGTLPYLGSLEVGLEIQK